VTTLYQQGRLTKADTGGLELNRNYESYLKIFEKIVNREGFGDILTEGWMKLKQNLA